MFRSTLHLLPGGLGAKVSFRCCEAEATFAINDAITSLYHSGLFVPAQEAKRIARQGLAFLSLYGHLAWICFQRKQQRFPMVPKAHYLHHQFLDMLLMSKRSPWVVSPLLYGVQMQEDYISKPSRLSRRVNPKTCSHRVLQRTFLAIRNALCEMT